jgi:hypothetical protein
MVMTVMMVVIMVIMVMIGRTQADGPYLVSFVGIIKVYVVEDGITAFSRTASW